MGADKDQKKPAATEKKVEVAPAAEKKADTKKPAEKKDGDKKEKPAAKKDDADKKDKKPVEKKDDKKKADDAKPAAKKEEAKKDEAKPAAEAAPRKPLGGEVASTGDTTKRNKRKPGAADGITSQGHQKLPPKEEEKPKPAAKAPKADDKKKTDAKPAAKKDAKAETETKRAEKKDDKKVNKKDAAKSAIADGKKEKPAPKSGKKESADKKSLGNEIDANLADPAIVSAKSSGPTKQKTAWNNKPAAPQQNQNQQQAVSHNVKLLCVMHGQMRFVNHMSRRPDGTYVCNNDKACKPEFSPAHERGPASAPSGNQRQGGQKQQRSTPPTHGIKKLCTKHSQMRFVNHMDEDSKGNFVCQAEKQCKPEFAATENEEQTHNVKKMCATHNQLRFVNHLEEKKNGDFHCRDDKTCRPDYVNNGNNAPRQQQQRPQKAQNPNHNVKKICQFHNQLRYLNALTQQEDGSYKCNEGKECQPEFANISSPQAVADRQRQRADNGQRGNNLPATHGQKAKCVNHNQMRYINHLHQIKNGDYICLNSHQCKPEYGAEGASNPYTKASSGQQAGGFW